jgi:hypothetical protein
MKPIENTVQEEKPQWPKPKKNKLIFSTLTFGAELITATPSGIDI